ncbi:PKD-like family lipoprotein [Alistipes sp.]|uniref:PKD-like family lipoprotein n=1 Tax=Alistipes sp. TaxID=1872444 RepID=UPI0025B82830|nr:PKD-like family lipoprotein [Alistipes sp.]
MKKILTCIVLAFAASGLAGCYEDKSTYATDQIPDIVLTDTETTSIYTGYLEQIDFAPELTQGGKVLEDNDNYTYTWELNEVPDENQFQTISTERELHVTVPNGISTTPYLLKLTVKDTENDLEYLFWWDLYIQSAFLDGLVISDTKDGATSDLTLVLNQKLTTNYAGKEEKIFRNILASGSSAAAYPGLLSSLTPMLYGYIYSKAKHYLWATDQNGELVRFNCEDYTVASGEDVLLYASEGQEFYKLFGTGNNYACQTLMIAMSNAGNYCIQCVSTEVFSWPNTAMNASSMKNGICASRSYSANNECIAAWLDEKTNKLIVADAYFGGYLTYNTITGSGAYDADNLGDQQVIAAGMTYTENIPALLLKDNAGTYAIYTITPHQAEEGYYTDPDNWEGWVVTSPEIPYGPRARIEIPAEGKALLDQATGTAFCTMQAILYVATADGIYAIDFASGKAVVSDVKFTPDAGEKITSVKLYQQGQYQYSSGMCGDGEDQYRELLDWTNYAVIVTTQKSDTEGCVYVVPMTQIGTGNLDKAQALKYDGFGKILDVTTTGY